MGLLLLFISLISAEDIVSFQESYYGHRYSTIQWEKINTLRWLDIDHWKEELARRDKEVLRAVQLREMMGRILKCVGQCKSFRGLSPIKATRHTSILEGDDLETMPDSFLWVFLLDGTMVRLAPESSITFKEINIGTHEIFLYVRINYGNVLWLSRDSSLFKEIKRKETDRLFLPLSTHGYKLGLRKRYKKLNDFIKQNNKMIKHYKTWSFVVLPHGTIWGADLRTDVIVLPGKGSYVKNRTSNELGLKKKDNPAPAVFYLRGFGKERQVSLDFGRWYKVGRRGRKIDFLQEKENVFSLGELITRRIPSILTAREILLKNYSSFVFDQNKGVDALAIDHGYRLWGRLFHATLEEDLEKRVLYLRRYTRIEESFNLSKGDRLRGGFSFKKSNAAYDNRFYRKAMDRLALD